MSQVQTVSAVWHKKKQNLFLTKCLALCQTTKVRHRRLRFTSIHGLIGFLSTFPRRRGSCTMVTISSVKGPTAQHWMIPGLEAGLRGVAVQLHHLTEDRPEAEEHVSGCLCCLKGMTRGKTHPMRCQVMQTFCPLNHQTASVSSCEYTGSMGPGSL